MQRRTFIQLTASGAIIGSLPLLYGCGSGSINPAAGQPSFLSRVMDQKSMLETGRAYLEKTPVENDKNKIADLLLQNSQITGSTDSNRVHQYFDIKIQQDFENSRTVIIKGWVLSVTEARQCALFSLMPT